MEAEKPKTMFEIMPGLDVEFNEALFDDFDFASELSKALNNNDLETMITMYMALVGGEDTYNEVRRRIEEENNGIFSVKALKGVFEKIEAHFPKSGNRAQRRSWKPSR